MNQAQLIVRMLVSSADVIKSYWTDIRHDAQVIAEAKNGDAFIWAPREMGTYIVVLNRGRKPNIKANELYSAMAKQDNIKQWYYIKIDEEHCVFEECNNAFDLAFIASTNAHSEAHVSEVHL